MISDCMRFWGGEFSSGSAATAPARRRATIRTDRVFEVDGAWYFATREKCRMGPFASREDALLEIQSMFAPNNPVVTA